MPRSRKSQTKHDLKVKKLAKQYQKKEYQVDADIEGYSKPETIGGLRPDLRVRKGGHETIIEVETPESKGTKRDLNQQQAFKKWTKRNAKRHFKRLLTEE